MPKFIYIGGETKSEFFDEVQGVDERQGVAMPDSTTAFGIKFIVGQPTEVSRSMFLDDARYQHALRKLELNRYFKPFAEEVAFEELPPPPTSEPAKRSPGRPAKLQAPTDAQ